MHGREIRLIQSCKESVVQKWITGWVKRFPEMYDSEKLHELGNRYFEFITDVHIPVERHPTFALLPGWCKMLAEKEVPLVHTLYNPHLFREILLDTISTFEGEHCVSTGIIKQISDRIDAFERAVCDYYWSYVRAQIEEKDRTISELHQDKLSIVGKMAASMAHELRNPLTAISGFLKLIRTHLSPESLAKVGKYMDIVEEEFESFQMQITGFLSFSKKSIMKEPFVFITIRPLLDSVITLLNPRLIYENVRLIVSIRRDSPLHMQKVAIQHVLSNVLNNSVDALSLKGDADRIIRIRDGEDDAHYYLTIINNGPQIPPDIQQHIFNPFVTGKSDNAGLGLTICKHIMREHCGDITFTSAKEETSFTLTFSKQAKTE